MCYTKFLKVLCASDTCLALTEAEVEMWEHAVQSNPVSERSKAFAIYLQMTQPLLV